MMARERLTNKVAEDQKAKAGTQVEAKGSGIDNDPYNMNDTGHEKNDPKIDEYAKGDPSAWAEDPNTANPAADDKKREETGHAPLIDKHAAAEAIASAKKLEEKAVKCIVASQRMLPGAADGVIEDQAADLMHLPEAMLNSTLQRQEVLAKAIAKAASESSEEAEEEDKEDEEVAAKKAKLASLQAEIAVLAAELNPSKEKEEKEEEKEEKEANADKDEDDKKEEEKEEKEANDDKDEDDKKEEEKEEKEASDSSDNLLDQIFGQVTASENKKGASSLSGMVKKEASSNSTDDLSGLWRAYPDVSQNF